MEDLGCYYWEIMIPSFVNLTEKSGYEFVLNGRITAVNVYQYVKAIVITDYSNDILKNGNNFELANSVLQVGKSSLGVFDQNKMEYTYIIDFSDNKRKEYNKVTYTQIIVRFESTKGIDNATIARKAFDHFYNSYQIVSDNFFALPIEHFHSYSIVQRDCFHSYTNEDLLKTELERIRSERPINLNLRRWDQRSMISNEYQANLDQKAHTKLLSKYLKAEKHNDFINETLLSANRELRVYKNYRYALLECFFIIENVIYNFIERKKINKGVSRKKLKDASSKVGISYLLNVELPMIVDTYDEKIKTLIQSLDFVRKLRNEIVHNGGSVNEADAEKAVTATIDMLNYFNIQKI